MLNEALRNRCQTPCNNSPVFNSQPFVIIFLGQDVAFNQGGHTVDTAGIDLGTTLFWVKVKKDGCEGFDSVLITLKYMKIDGNNNSYLQKMNISEIPKGIYFLHFFTNGKIGKIKLFKN